MRSIALQVKAIIKGLTGGSAFEPSILQTALRQYANLVEPWAHSVAGVMLASTAQRNRVQWRQHSAKIGRGLRHEIENAPTGAVMQNLLQEQVVLIKSLPLKAAEAAQAIVQNNVPTGKRHTAIIPDIQALGDMTEARARLIARTETSKAASALTQARAQYVGSDGYIWRTMRDGDVRDSHKDMEGKYVRWQSPPTLDKMTGHAGCTPNCRCFAEVVLPGEEF